jgi:hypothetical protein
MPTKAILPYAGINVLGSFSLAGFQVTIIGRIWVTAEAAEGFCERGRNRIRK